MQLLHRRHFWIRDAYCIIRSNKGSGFTSVALNGNKWMIYIVKTLFLCSETANILFTVCLGNIMDCGAECPDATYAAFIREK